MGNLDKILENAPQNSRIIEVLTKCYHIVDTHNKIYCAISGGSDSDIVLDMLLRCGGGSKTKFAFYDTGIEYEATKEHLCDLEQKYGIEIERCKAIKSVPLSCKEYGVPFLSKYASRNLDLLQRRNFQWEDMSVDELREKYPKTLSAIRWWCNDRPEGSTTTQYIIGRNKYLKEFIMYDPPKFKISDKCCTYAKKETAHAKETEDNYDLLISGVRRAEGGTRTMSKPYSTCFSRQNDGKDHYYPILWFSNLDKEEYDDYYKISHSKCYTQYGLKRTGCFACPFGYMRNGGVQDIDSIRPYEPKLANAAEKIFGESYEYTQKYMEFREKMKKLE